MKLTNTICDQCHHYARRIACKLSENNYFIDLKRTRSFNVSKKVGRKQFQFVFIQKGFNFSFEF